MYIVSELAKLKTVPLEVPLQGEDSDGIERTVTVPEEIILKGKAADLEAIDFVRAEPIDLTGVMTSTTIPVIPILPEGVELSLENGAFEVVVEVTKTETRSLTFDQTKITFEGLGADLSAQAADTALTLSITGSESQLGTLMEDDVTIVADLTGLDAGRHKVQLQAVCNVEGVVFEISPKKVTVMIKTDQTETETDQSGSVDNNNENNNHEGEE
jgi:YbbR domain-containing protein